MLTRKNQDKDPAVDLALQKYLYQTKKHWKYSYSAIALTGVGSIFVFFIPTYVVAKLVSKLVEDTTVSTFTLLTYVAIIGITWFIGEMLWRLAYRLESMNCAIVMRKLFNDALEELLKKDTDFFNNNFAGSLTKNVSAYARNYERFYGVLAFQIAPNLIPIIFASIILATYSPYISLILIAMLVISFFLAAPLIRKRRKLVKKREDASTHLVGHVADVIGNAAAVRTFAHEDKELDTHKENVDDFIKKAKRSWDYQTNVVDMLVSPLYVLTNVLGLTAVILLGKGSGGTLSTEAVLVTFGYFSTATRALFEFNQIYRDLETSLSEASQFTTYLLDKPAIQDRSTDILTVTNAKIVFDNVTFSYSDEKNRAVFSDFNLVIEPGESIGLVGHSGSGKTTITKLLLRFMDIDSGAITVDDQNIATITQQSLRQNIATVPQEPVMFHRTIHENIAYGKSDATKAEVIAAAKKAHAHDFIMSLPHGYETYVGERGVKLSGGQRQRIAIARAIVKDAPILLLDEATSALDSESEKLIQDALRELMSNKTTIVIAHRLSTIQKMDRIVVLDNGKIIEQGSHKSLLSKNGAYAKLWQHQSGGFLEE